MSLTRSRTGSVAVALLAGAWLYPSCLLTTDLTGLEASAAGAGGHGGSGASNPATGGSGGHEPLTCEPGEKVCDGACVRLDDPLFGCMTDACTPCAFAGGVSACSGGVCTLLDCLSGFANCDGDGDNGCEIDLVSDGDNCGQCGVRCVAANGDGACKDSTCTVGACAAGFTDCDKLPGNGCETNTDWDTSNCNECNMPCPGTLVCEKAACVASLCVGDPGMANCDGLDANGCETNTQTSNNHCGLCNNPCNYFSGSGSCSTGTCQLDSCLVTWGNCNGNDADGCETDLETASQHCGACENDCGGGACLKGLCQPLAILVGEQSPSGLAEAGGTIYWVSETEGEVLRADHDGQGRTVLATNQFEPHRIAATNNQVFWNTSDARVVEMMLGGQPTTLFEASVPPGQLKVNGGFLYASDPTNGIVWSYEISTSNVTDLVNEAESGYGLAVTDNFVFIALLNDQVILRAEPSTGAVLPIISGQDQPNEITVEGTTVFWTNRGGQVSRATDDGNLILVLATNQGDPVSPVVLDSYVYWLNREDGQLMRVKKDGAAAAQEITGGLADPQQLIAVDKMLFFTDRTDGLVYRVATHN